MKKLVITTVADPMMGMLWETWPTMRKLETHYGEQLEFKFLSGQLVKNVYDLVDPNVRKQFGDQVALNQYWVRLMQIYLQEEQIGNMPIYMGGNERLFDERHLSSVPLNQGLLTIAGDQQPRLDQVLYEMQYDTVINNLQTNDIKYLTTLAQRFGMDAEQFTTRYNSATIKRELDNSEQARRQLQIDQLPAYLLTYQGKTFVVKGLPKYGDWKKLIHQVTDGSIIEQMVKFDDAALDAFINKHPHISQLELQTAFDVNEQVITDALATFDLEKQRVKGTIFYRKKG
ncbi:MAG TPA: DsbA family protein [Candidatus Limosilactobacillus excrementigallinarum]|nr:DsbA family protein [Candidatus Limosilactobacillus excrementigallinarum]